MKYKMFFSFVIALFFSQVHSQEIDVLLKGGHLIDPKNKIDEVMDVAIVGEKIFRIASDIPASTSKRTIDWWGAIAYHRRWVLRILCA